MEHRLLAALPANKGGRAFWTNFWHCIIVCAKTWKFESLMFSYWWGMRALNPKMPDCKACKVRFASLLCETFMKQNCWHNFSFLKQSPRPSQLGFTPVSRHDLLVSKLCSNLIVICVFLVYVLGYKPCHIPLKYKDMYKTCVRLRSACFRYTNLPTYEFHSTCHAPTRKLQNLS